MKCELCGHPAVAYSQAGIPLCPLHDAENEAALARHGYSRSVDAPDWPDEPLNPNPQHEGEFEDEPCEGAVQMQYVTWEEAQALDAWFNLR